MLLLEMKHITKSFAGVYVDEDVDLPAGQGEIHALLGENGTSKTTLMNILFGIYQADRGETCFKGEYVEFKSSGETIARGIGMMHQHLSLVKKMMVLDNMVLGLKEQGIVTDRKLAREKLTGPVTTYGFLVNPEAPVRTLSVGERQRVEILEALYRDVSLLILDRPTGVLISQGTENFSRVLKQLRDEGYGIIIIAHRLGEIVDISDRVTVFRDDRKVSSLVTEETVPEELSVCMIGRKLKARREIGGSAAGNTALSLRGVYLHKKHGTKMSLDHVSLTVRREKILGIAGMEDNGQKELAEVITGIRRIDSRQMEYQGKSIRKDGVKERFRADISYISDDRHGDSPVMDTTVEDSLILGDFDRQSLSRNMVLGYRQAEEKAREILDKYSAKTSGKSGSKTPVRLASGGNQQKIILPREIFEEAGLIVASQPTRGLDTGATRFVHETLLRQRGVGKCVLLTSADLDEILGVSGWVTVMYKGRIIGILDQDEVDVHKTGLLMDDIAKEATDEQKIKDS